MLQKYELVGGYFDGASYELEIDSFIFRPEANGGVEREIYFRIGDQLFHEELICNPYWDVDYYEGQANVKRCLCVAITQVSDSAVQREILFLLEDRIARGAKNDAK